MALTPAQKMKRYRATHPDAKGGGNAARDATRAVAPFYGFDGEGKEDENGRHVLYTLRAGDAELYNGGASLGSREILTWITKLPHATYIGFALEYDFTMILRDIAGIRDGKGRDVLGRIIRKSGLTRTEQRFGIAIPGWGVRVSWMSHKHLIVSTTGGEKRQADRVAPGVLAGKVDAQGRSVLDRLAEGKVNATEAKRGIYVPSLDAYMRWTPGEELVTTRKVRTVRISDTFGLFQGSFVATCRKWGVGTPAELDTMQTMKDKRGAFTGDDAEREYNRVECVFMAELLGKVRDACSAAGIRPRNWEGAGKLAEAMLTQRKMPKVARAEGRHMYPQKGDITLPDDVSDIADWAYYGGRFEATRTGIISDKVYDYDINSAYPHAMRSLPCLLDGHGTWTHDSTRLTPNSVCRVSWSPTGDAFLGPFPIRTKHGQLTFPLSNLDDTSEWYWWSEVSAALDSGLFHVDIHESFTWVQTCPCPPPYGWVEDVYLQRLELGSSDKGMVLKLAINSLYGKTAQMKGQAPYLNKVYAGMITALCRSMIFRAATAVGQRNVLMIATDGIFTTVPMPRTLTGRKVLGEWDETVAGGICIAQPGIYLMGDAYKSRGISSRAIRENWEKIDSTFRTAWMEVQYPAPVTLNIGQRFNGLRLAWHQGHTERAGQWDREVTHRLNLVPVGKRSTEWYPQIATAGLNWTWTPIRKASHESFTDVRAESDPELDNLVASENGGLLHGEDG